MVFISSSIDSILLYSNMRVKSILANAKAKKVEQEIRIIYPKLT